MYKLEMKIFAGSTTHQFTGGANLISAVLVLAIMILPTVINISEASLRAVPKHLKNAYPDDFQSNCSGGALRHHHGGGFRLRTCDRGGNGDQPGIWKFSQSAASI